MNKDDIEVESLDDEPEVLDHTIEIKGFQEEKEEHEYDTQSIKVIKTDSEDKSLEVIEEPKIEIIEEKEEPLPIAEEVKSNVQIINEQKEVEYKNNAKKTILITIIIVLCILNVYFIFLWKNEEKEKKELLRTKDCPEVKEEEKKPEKEDNKDKYNYLYNYVHTSNKYTSDNVLHLFYENDVFETKNIVNYPKELSYTICSFISENQDVLSLEEKNKNEYSTKTLTKITKKIFDNSIDKTIENVTCNKKEDTKYYVYGKMIDYEEQDDTLIINEKVVLVNEDVNREVLNLKTKESISTIDTSLDVTKLLDNEKYYSKYKYTYNKDDKGEYHLIKTELVK